MKYASSDFTELVEAALDGLPPEIAGLLDNVVVMVEDWPEDDYLYGLYEGVPLTERGNGYYGALPDRITIFQGPLEKDFKDPENLKAQVRVTVVHEIAHHFGFDEDRLRELGWA